MISPEKSDLGSVMLSFVMKICLEVNDLHKTKRLMSVSAKLAKAKKAKKIVASVTERCALMILEYETMSSFSLCKAVCAQNTVPIPNNKKPKIPGHFFALYVYCCGVAKISLLFNYNNIFTYYLNL